MAGVTQAKAWFRKSRVYSSLKRRPHLKKRGESDSVLRPFKVCSQKTPNVGAGTYGIWGPREEAQRPLHETMRLAEAQLVRHAPGGYPPKNSQNYIFWLLLPDPSFLDLWKIARYLLYLCGLRDITRLGPLPLSNYVFTVARFDVFQMNWVMFPWQAVSCQTLSALIASAVSVVFVITLGVQNTIYNPPSKHYKQKRRGLHNRHVIQCASRNYTWKAYWTPHSFFVNKGSDITCKDSGWTSFRKRAEYGFGEYGFQTLNSVSFLGLTEFWGESSVSSFQPMMCVCQSELTEFVAELTEFAPKTQWGSVSSLLRNSTLETVFRPFPIFGCHYVKLMSGGPSHYIIIFPVKYR